MKSLKIDEIRKIELDILDYIVNFCKENGIKYYLCGGTMLGAIRHKGYIPWDDDIDLYMKRDDYEYFLKLFKEKNIDSKYSIIDDEYPEYYYPFCKVTNNTTIAKMDDNKTEHGIWVDIFPIDFLPDNPKKRVKYIKRLYYYRAIILAMTTDFKDKKISKKILIKKVLNIYSNLIGKKKIYSRYKKLISRVQKEAGTKYAATLFPTYGLNEIFKSEDIFNHGVYNFEGRLLNGPKNYDVYLSSLYGEYMKLPPEEKRRVHSIIAWYK